MKKLLLLCPLVLFLSSCSGPNSSSSDMPRIYTGFEPVAQNDVQAMGFRGKVKEYAEKRDYIIFNEEGYIIEKGVLYGGPVSAETFGDDKLRRNKRTFDPTAARPKAPEPDNGDELVWEGKKKLTRMRNGVKVSETEYYSDGQKKKEVIYEGGGYTENHYHNYGYLIESKEYRLNYQAQGGYNLIRHDRYNYNYHGYLSSEYGEIYRYRKPKNSRKPTREVGQTISYSYSYEYDDQGNWTMRTRSGLTIGNERFFSYYD